MLLDRQLGLETDTRKVKYGDGATAWSDLAYATGPAAPLGAALAVTRFASSTLVTLNTSFPTIILPTVSFDTDAIYNTSTGIITLAAAGVYLLMGSARVQDSPSAGINYGIGIGSASDQDTAWFTWAVTAGNRQGVRTHRLYSAAAGDQLRLYGYSDNPLPLIVGSLAVCRVR